MIYLVIVITIFVSSAATAARFLRWLQKNESEAGNESR